MANPLTGDYQAVIQINVRQINGLLGLLHQHRINPAASPSFSHWGRIRYGTEAHVFTDDMLRVSKWLTSPGMQVLTMQGQDPFKPVALKPAPGMISFYESVVNDYHDAILETLPGNVPRGIAEVQISTPTVSLAPGATSAVTIEARVRARLYADSGSSPMPEYVHGDVSATYTVSTVVVNGVLKLRVHPPTHDNQVKFFPLPGSGVSPAQTGKVIAEIRRALQKNFAPLDVDLPAGLPFTQFRALAGPGGSTALALPLQINAPSPGPGSIGTVTQHVINYQEMGLAISREFVETMTNPLILGIQASIEHIPEVEDFWGDYTFSGHDFKLTWKPGLLEFTGVVEAKTSGVFAPDKTFNLFQGITVVIVGQVPNQTLKAIPSGPPDVNDQIINYFIPIRDNALDAASASINTQFLAAQAQLTAGLRSFDPSAKLKWTEVQITPDGLILRGQIIISDRIAPIVHVQETDGGTAFTALESWVPGGRIDRFEWTWVKNESVIPWANPIQSHSEYHRFIYEKPPDFGTEHRMCLRIEGTVISPDGMIESATGGDICRPSGYEKILIVPPWYLELYLPDWWPDPPFDAVMDEWITAHINVAGQPSNPYAPAVNTLIHFVGERFERTLDVLGEALGRAEFLRERTMNTVVVLPEGTFASTRREVLEARLGRGERLRAGSIQITEDIRGGWTRAFLPENASSGPSTVLMNARRDLAWSHPGELDRDRLLEALEKFTLPAAPAAGTPMRLVVDAGDAALDAVFEDINGERTSLHRLHGRRVLLVFWKSWSTPCLKELEHLREERDDETVVLAINGGEESGVFAEVGKQLGLRFSLIKDPAQDIATMYGVSCWPTTVSINREGFVDRVQLGRSHAHHEPYGMTHETEGN